MYIHSNHTSMSDTQMQKASKPMGKTLKWSQEEVTDTAKHVYLGPVVKGILTARDEYMDAMRAAQGKPPSKIYKIKLDNGEFVSVWETAMIRDAMEEGNNGGQVPIGAVVEFQHQGKKQGKNKAAKPYHVIDVLFGIPSPAMQSAQKSQPTVSNSMNEAKAPAPSADNSGGW